MHELEELMAQWRKLYDERGTATEELQQQLAEAVAPFAEQMAELEAQIKSLMLAQAQTHEAPHLGVKASYRKGYERVSYDRVRTDSVLGILRDIMPQTADVLEAARKISYVKPSVSVKAIDKLPF